MPMYEIATKLTLNVKFFPPVEEVKQHADSLGFTVTFKDNNVVLEVRCGFYYKYDKTYPIYKGKIHGMDIANPEDIYKHLWKTYEMPKEEEVQRFEYLADCGFFASC